MSQKNMLGFLGSCVWWWWWLMMMMILMMSVCCLLTTHKQDNNKSLLVVVSKPADRGKCVCVNVRGGTSCMMTSLLGCPSLLLSKSGIMIDSDNHLQSQPPCHLPIDPPTPLMHALPGRKGMHVLLLDLIVVRVAFCCTHTRPHVSIFIHICTQGSTQLKLIEPPTHTVCHNTNKHHNKHEEETADPAGHGGRRAGKCGGVCVLLVCVGLCLSYPSRTHAHIYT